MLPHNNIFHQQSFIYNQGIEASFYDWGWVSSLPQDAFFCFYFLWTIQIGFLVDQEIWKRDSCMIIQPVHLLFKIPYGNISRDHYSWIQIHHVNEISFNRFIKLQWNGMIIQPEFSFLLKFFFDKSIPILHSILTGLLWVFHPR